MRILLPQQLSTIQKQLEGKHNIDFKFVEAPLAVSDIRNITNLTTTSFTSASSPLSLLLAIIDRKKVLTISKKMATNAAQDNQDALSFLFSKKRNLSSLTSYALCVNDVDVLSHVITFESLWKQINVYNQIIDHNKTQEEFLNIAAHELRTPIQPILFMVQMLLSKIKDPKQHELLNVINKNVKKLQQLADDILEVTGIESGTLSLSKERFNLNDLVYDIIQDFKNDIVKVKSEERMHEEVSEQKLLLVEPENDVIFFVDGDKGRLAQVVSNLLDNSLLALSLHKSTYHTGAIEANPDNNKKNNTAVEIRLSDTGTGIDPKIFPRLFTKFTTKSHKGTGLGLFISKSIIEAHGGRIWAENNEKKAGCTFHVLLPAQISELSSSSEKTKIFLVDDDSNFASKVKMELEANNQYEVDIVSDPSTVLENYVKGLYDLVILDIDLLNISSFDLCQQIRQRDTTVKIYYLTAFGTRYDAFRDIYGISDKEYFLKREDLEKGNLHLHF